MKANFDIGVVGLGAVGSAAAYHASQSGFSVVGFDQFAPPHTLGSAHGGSRIFRRAYFEGSMYLPLLSRAYELWRRLEDASGRTLLHLNGCLTIGPADGATLRGAQAGVEAYDIPFERLSPKDVHNRFPAFHLREAEAALWEPEAGWLDPEECIRAHLDLAARSGAALRTDEKVLKWGVLGDGVRIETAAGTFDVDRLILCAGGWIAPLLREIHVPLQIERQINAWFHATANDRRFRPEHCPVYIWEYEPERVLYGFPEIDGGVKTGLHHTDDFVDHPDDLDRAVHEADISALQRWTKMLLPQTGDASRAATCFYTNTPDRHFLIDRHPGLARVVFASACSGHGFKASNAVGECLVLLALDDEPAVDLSAFRLARFKRV